MHYCTFKEDKRKGWMCNLKFIRFFPGILLSVNNFRKLNFCISLFIAKNHVSFSGRLGSQAVTFDLLRINNNLFLQVIMFYFLKKGDFLPL